MAAASFHRTDTRPSTGGATESPRRSESSVAFPSVDPASLAFPSLRFQSPPRAMEQGDFAHSAFRSAVTPKFMRSIALGGLSAWAAAEPLDTR